MRASRISPSARGLPVPAPAAPLLSVWLLAVLLGFSWGCDSREKAAPARVVDLVELLPSADVRGPTTRLELGEASARPALVSGWHPATFPRREGERAGWTVGPGAQVEIFVARAEPLELVLHGAPVPHAGSVPPELTVELNGSEVHRETMSGSWKDYRMSLPAELLSPGENLLTLDHPPEQTPRQPKKDTRIAWTGLEVVGVEEPPAVRRIEGEKALFIPVGRRVDYYLDLPPGSRWRAAQVVPRGEARALEIGWLPLDEEASSGEQLFERVQDAAWSLPSAGAGRLSLRAVGEGDGVVVAEPRIEIFGAIADPAGSPKSSDGSEATGERAHVFVYLIDTLRADHLGAYGYGRATSPRIDAFAREAVLFENAQAQAPWTRASVASMMTGLWPSVHGAEDDPDALPEAATTLAEHLGSAGWETSAVVSNGNVSRPFGFAQGFDHFTYLDPDKNDGKIYRAFEVHERVFDRLDARESTENPVFVYLHTMNPHAPYEAPEPYHSQMSEHPVDPSFGSVDHLIGLALDAGRAPEGTRERLIDLYDAEILANDDAFGQFLDGLETRGLLENSWIALLSDHGEEFLDHGDWQHGHTLHVEQLAIPLIVRPPGGLEGGVRRREVVEHVDLLPTLLDVLGLPAAEPVQGRSFRPLLGPGPVEDWDHQAVAELNLRGIQGKSLIDRAGRFKTISTRFDGERAFPHTYDLRADPGELRGADRRLWNRGRYLEARLRRLSEERPRPFDPVAAEVPEELEEQLEALGYAR